MKVSFVIYVEQTLQIDRYSVGRRRAANILFSLFTLFLSSDILFLVGREGEEERGRVQPQTFGATIQVTL